MEWQPIETAPKDGSSIILCYARCENGSEWDGGASIMIGTFDGQDFSVRTGVEFSDMSYLTRLVCPWTHWLPLPEMPKQD